MSKKTLISTLVGITVVLAFSIYSGCTGKMEEEEGTLGKEATGEELDLVLARATAGITGATAQVGNYNYYEYNARIEMNPFFKTQDIDRALIAVKDTDLTRTMVYFENYRAVKRNGEIKDEWHKEQSVVYQKSAGAAGTLNSNSLVETSAIESSPFSKQALRSLGRAFNPQAQLFAKATEENPCDGNEEEYDDGNHYDCIRYFNIQTERRKVPAPAAVKSRPNCLGLEGCKLTVQFVSYDTVYWSEGKAVDKVSIKMTIAKQVPHLFPESTLPPTVSICTRQKQDFEDFPNVMITMCRVLRDFDL